MTLVASGGHPGARDSGGGLSINPFKSFEPYDCIIYSLIIIQIINGPIQDLTSSFKLLISCLSNRVEWGRINCVER